MSSVQTLNGIHVQVTILQLGVLNV